MTSKQVLSSLFFVLLLSQPVAGQVRPLQDDYEMVEVVRPTREYTSRLVLIVDISGSMRPRLSAALDASLNLVSEVWATDEANLKVIVFDTRVFEFPGEDDGWSFPSPDLLDEVETWINANADDQGTCVEPALRTAFEVQEEALTILLVTDGNLIHERGDRLLAIVAGLQEARVEAELGVVVLGVVDVGAGQTWLEEMAEAGGGGLIRLRGRDDD
jgi:Mg-chelatase subunit ChlD